MGGRRLRKEMTQPLTDIDMITSRHDVLSILISNDTYISKLQESMKGIGDLERINARIITERAVPRDLVNLADGIGRLPLIKSYIEGLEIDLKSGSVFLMNELKEYIEKSIDRDSVLNGSKERFIKKGFNDEYDRLSNISSNVAEQIIKLEQEEKDRTGINTLRVGYNNVTGYYIEVTNSNKPKVPQDYIRKQTLKNAERYVNDALRLYEQEIFTADERLLKMEQELFNGIVKKISADYENIKKNCEVLSYIDMLVSFAHCSKLYDYLRPTMTVQDELMIENGRHPVVERMNDSGKFVPNNLIMDNSTRIILLTGPNMAGKSTYLRQNAIIIYMAHIGMFVPAQKSIIPITDRIFTRIGASDDISRGVSTFMAEMLETANIINNMTNRSFIVLDEIGRGTSTFDGLSIAWAIVEYLHETEMRPKTLFATHYHELTELAVKLERLKNCTVKVRGTEKKRVFLRKVVDVSSDESYGIEVARMAGLPNEITENAFSILHLLKENEESIKEKMRDVEQLKLFGKQMQKSGNIENDSIIKDLEETDIENMTPLNALIFLQEIKKKIKGS